MKNKSKSISSFFAKLFAIGLIFSVSNAYAKEEKKVNKQKEAGNNKIQKTVDVTSPTEGEIKEGETKEGEEIKEEKKGIITGDIYGGAKSKAKFSMAGSNSDKDHETSTSLSGFIGAKLEYAIPDFDLDPIKANIRIGIHKNSFEDKDFTASLPLAYFEIWKFKLGNCESLFNKNIKGIPQFRFTWGFDSGVELALGFEGTSTSDYFKNGSKEPKSDEDKKNYGKELFLTKNGTAVNEADEWDYRLRKNDLFPAAIVFSVKYKIEDLLENSLAFLVRPISYTMVNKNNKDQEDLGIIPAFGGNFNTSVSLLSKWTKLNLGVIFGKGIGSCVSDYNGKFIVKQEKERNVLFGLDKNNEIDDKDHPITLWGFRGSIGITQNITKAFSVNLGYLMETADEEIGMLFKAFITKEKDESAEDEKKRKEDTGAKKEHKVKADLTWDMNGEGKIKTSIGVVFKPVNDDNPVDIYGMIKIDLS